MSNSVSVILPYVSDNNKVADFCTSLFASDECGELIICGEISESVIESIKDFADKIKIIPDSGSSSIIKAITASAGHFIMFSDVSVSFSQSCLEKLIENSAESAAACNIGKFINGESSKIFREKFRFEELADVPVYYNYLLRKSVIADKKIMPVSNSAFSLMSFIAEYAVFDDFSLVHEVMMYTDCVTENLLSKEDLHTIKDLSSFFAFNSNDMASLYYINSLFSVFGVPDSEETFALIKTALLVFNANYSICSFITEKFGIDSCVLLEGSSFDDFSAEAVDVKYKEVHMPLIADDIVMEFYSGKLGADTLKRCVGAWIYYKLYRGKSGVIKKFGCILCRRLLGGEFVE